MRFSPLFLGTADDIKKLLEEIRYSDNPLLKIDNLPTGSYHKYRAEIPERGRIFIEDFLKDGGYQD